MGSSPHVREISRESLQEIGKPKTEQDQFSARQAPLWEEVEEGPVGVGGRRVLIVRRAWSSGARMYPDVCMLLSRLTLLGKEAAMHFRD